MLPNLVAKIAVDAVGSTANRKPELNEDYEFHLRAEEKALATKPWFLRMLPALLRNPLEARLAARSRDRMLIDLWETSPHLLRDVGVVLTDNEALPEHLVAASTRLRDHVAAKAPEQIVAAELEFPKPQVIRVEAAPQRGHQEKARLVPKLAASHQRA